VGAVFGTHTHVPTADAEILPEGTAYISDLGMSGPYDGVLGRDKEAVISRFIDGIPRRFPVAEHDVRLSGVILEIDEISGKATSISHHFWRP
jgi:2',3'-cyclic-nucleotide 2'-phosphodiesterase